MSTKPSPPDADRHQEWPAITEFSVEGLFGRYEFVGKKFYQSKDDENSIALFYGDNGSGKTTILRLIYSLLSKNGRQGNRTTLARIPFRLFEVKLLNNTTITVTKLHGLIGSYSIIVISPTIYETYIAHTNERGSVTSTKAPDIDRYEQYLESLDLDLLFLQDDRTIKSTYPFFDTGSSKGPHTYFDLTHPMLYRSLQTGRISDLELSELSEDALRRANLDQIIDVTFSWLTSKAIKETSTGEENAFNVYVEVTKALSKGHRSEEASSDRIHSLKAQLGYLDTIVPAYVRHNLLPPYSFSAFQQALEKAPASRKAEIADVLTPYIESVLRRLSSLSEVQLIISTFENEINKFLTRKRVSVSIFGGITFVDDTNAALTPSELSSGERQLVFLFCSALLSRDGNSIFLIDEPEISLNVKWQRQLIKSLNEIAHGGRHNLSLLRTPLRY